MPFRDIGALTWILQFFSGNVFRTAELLWQNANARDVVDELGLRR